MAPSPSSKRLEVSGTFNRMSDRSQSGRLLSRRWEETGRSRRHCPSNAFLFPWVGPSGRGHGSELRPGDKGTDFSIQNKERAGISQQGNPESQSIEAERSVLGNTRASGDCHQWRHVLVFRTHLLGRNLEALWLSSSESQTAAGDEGGLDGI